MTGSIPDIRPDFDKANYDKTKIAPYTLEDPLTFIDGRRVTTPEEWQRRRKEILGIFASEMYGTEPPPLPQLLIEKFEEKTDALTGYAVRSQFRMRFSPDGKGGEIQWLLLRPFPRLSNSRRYSSLKTQTTVSRRFIRSAKTFSVPPKQPGARLSVLPARRVPAGQR